MKNSHPQLIRETLLDLVLVDQGGAIWLQQGKEYNSDWRLIDRQTTTADLIDYAYEQLTGLGFLVHELTLLREGSTFWTYEGKHKRAHHAVILAEVNYAYPPTETSTHYLGAFPYNEAAAIPQRFFSDLRLLNDPAIEAASRRIQQNRLA